MVSEATALFEMVPFQARRNLSIYELHESSDAESLGGTRLGALVSGIGMVNVAMATEALITQWDPDIIALVGCAGAIVPDILPGDVVIGKDLCHYSSFQTLPDGSVNLDIPSIRFRTDYTLAPDRSDYSGGDRVRTRFIHSSPSLIRAALDAGSAAAASGSLAAWAASKDWPVEFRKPRCLAGVIGTADQINSDPEVIRVIRERYGVDAEECEGSAVGQVALAHRKPFIVIRGISDNEVLKPTLAEYLKTGTPGFETFEIASTRNAWIVFLGMLRNL